MVVYSGSCFHTVKWEKPISESGVAWPTPDPLTLGVNEVMIDGKLETITATSGQKQYLIVEPGDYPANMNEALKRGLGHR